MREPFLFMAVVFPFFRMIFRRLFELYYFLTKGGGMRLMGKVMKAVEERRKAKRAGEKTQGDFIDMFLEVEDDAFDLDYDRQFDRKEVGHIQRFLTKEETIGSCFMFLLAGFDTTANSLGYATYFLARHPEIQERLRDEVRAVIGDQKVRFDHFSEMKFLECFIKESMRIHPLAAEVSARIVERDCELAGIHLEKGTVIQFDIYGLHKDREIWGDDAEENGGLRWMNATAEQSQCFLAFGAGPRICVGQRLGLAEMKMALVKLLLNFEVTVPENASDEIITRGSITVAPQSIDVHLKKIDSHV